MEASVERNGVASFIKGGRLESPPVGDYAGTVKKQDVAAPWIGAILQVREQHPQIGARTVRLLVEKDTEIVPGDAMTVRFLDRARSATSRVAFGAMALN